MTPNWKVYIVYIFFISTLDTGLFSGKVSIEVESQESREFFLVHTKYLDIEQWRISKNGRDIAIAEAFEYKPNEFFVMKLENAVEKGKYIIDLRKSINHQEIYISIVLPLS